MSDKLSASIFFYFQDIQLKKTCTRDFFNVKRAQSYLCCFYCNPLFHVDVARRDDFGRKRGRNFVSTVCKLNSHSYFHIYYDIYICDTITIDYCIIFFPRVIRGFRD